jgi:MFS family permease
MSTSSRPALDVAVPNLTGGPAPRRSWLPVSYGWVNVFLAALAMTATLPGRTHGLGLITQPLLDDLRLDEVRYGALNFWAILLGATFCLPVGRTLDRTGARAVLTAVPLALGGVVVLMSGVRGWVMLFVFLVLVRGLGQGALSVASMALVGKWFRRRLGPAMGLFAVLLAVGFIAATLGTGAAVLAYGWRAAWAGLGWVLVLGVAPLCWLLVRSTPGAADQEFEQQGPAEADRPAPDATLAQALRAPAFWAFSLATSLFGLLWSAITLFNQAILEEHHFGAETFYLVMALLTASGLVANLVGGWLSTRWPQGRLLGIGMLLLAGCLAAFPGVHTPAQVVLYALGLGAAGGVITVVFFAFYGQAYGRAHLGQIQGAAQVLSVFASALGPLVLAACKAHTGSYDLLFYASAPAAVALGAWAWAVSPDRPARPAVKEGGA